MQLYDDRRDEPSLNEVERIAIEDITYGTFCCVEAISEYAD